MARVLPRNWLQVHATHAVLRYPAGVDPAFFDLWPKLKRTLPFVPLGVFPTPVQSLEPALRAAGGLFAGSAWVKRDDASSPIYGGNKVRTLEVLFAEALDRGATQVFSTGAYGSNHALATVLHAPRVGLEPGVLLIPQPASATAAANLTAGLAAQPAGRWLRHWSQLPTGLAFTLLRARLHNKKAVIMPPGGATPRGTLGYVAAGLELAHQVHAGLMPRPTRIVLAVGSTCTTAGLLVGLRLAAQRGIGFIDRAGKPAVPLICAVRVTPWPVTAPQRIVRLAHRASLLLARLSGDASAAIDPRVLSAGLEVDGRWLGRGYGHATTAGFHAARAFAAVENLTLDTTYSAKAGAALLDIVRRNPEPLLFWATKSSAPLPGALDEPAGFALNRWLQRARRGGTSPPAGCL